MQLREQQYDPGTCITAGDLRKAGFAVPDHLPDHAWIPKRAVKRQVVGAERVPGQDKVAIRVRLHFDEPWRWADPLRG